MLNPNRARFNNSVFEGGVNPITENQEIMKNIHDINLKDYNRKYKIRLPGFRIM